MCRYSFYQVKYEKTQQSQVKHNLKSSALGPFQVAKQKKQKERKKASYWMRHLSVFDISKLQQIRLIKPCRQAQSWQTHQFLTIFDVDGSELLSVY